MDRGSMLLPNNQSLYMDKNGEPLDVKIIKAKDIDDQLSEIHLDERRISLLPAEE